MRTSATALWVALSIAGCKGPEIAEDVITQPSEPQNDVQKLMVVRDQLPSAIPCHQLGVKHYQSYPAFRVLDTWFSSSGWFSSSEYEAQAFLPISRQRFAEGDKRYFLPAFYSDLTGNPQSNASIGQATMANAQFVGFISYKVAQVRERYDQKKHSVVLSGYGYPNTVSDSDAVPRYFVNGGDPYVVYEICFDPQIHTKYGSYAADPEFPIGLAGRDGQRYEYGPYDTPTYIGYEVFENDRLKNWIGTLDKVETGIKLIGYATPGVNAALEYVDCKEGGDAYCWAKFAATLGGDFAAGGALLNLGKHSGKLTLLSAFANLTVGGLYALDQDQMSAAGVRLASGASDLFILYLTYGRIAVSKAKVAGQCVKGEKEVLGHQIETNAGDFLASCSRIVEPANAKTKAEFRAAVAEGQAQKPGMFGAPAVRRVYRIDRRPPSGILEAGGHFPNPGRYPSSIFDHVKRDSNGSSSFVSTTTHEDVSLFVTHPMWAPVADDPRHDLDLIGKPWDPSWPLPPAVEYRSYEYSADSLVTVLNSSHPDVANGEAEAVARALRVDEGMRFRDIKVVRPFVIDQHADGSHFLNVAGFRDASVSVSYGEWHDIAHCAPQLSN